MTTLNEADAADRRTVGFAERIKAGTDAAHRETEQLPVRRGPPRR